jgi:hypothetical protein
MFRDLRDLVELVVLFIGVSAIVVTITLSLAAGAIYVFDKQNCAKVWAKSYETDFTFWGGCMIKIDDHYIPVSKFEYKDINAEIK